MMRGGGGGTVDLRLVRRAGRRVVNVVSSSTRLKSSVLHEERMDQGFGG